MNDGGRKETFLDSLVQCPARCPVRAAVARTEDVPPPSVGRSARCGSAGVRAGAARDAPDHVLLRMGVPPLRAALRDHLLAGAIRARTPQPPRAHTDQAT